jgi:hypothetical protein
MALQFFAVHSEALATTHDALQRHASAQRREDQERLRGGQPYSETQRGAHERGRTRGRHHHRKHTRQEGVQHRVVALQ